MTQPTTPAAPSPEFRVGQRVRLNSKEHGCSRSAGGLKIGDVLEVTHIFAAYIQVDGAWCLDGRDLTPEPPKVEGSCAACGATEGLAAWRFSPLDCAGSDLRVCLTCVQLAEAKPGEWQWSLTAAIAARRSAPTSPDSYEARMKTHPGPPPAKAAEPDPPKPETVIRPNGKAQYKWDSDVYRGKVEWHSLDERIAMAAAELSQSTASRKARLRLAGKYGPTKWQEWPKGGDDEP